MSAYPASPDLQSSAAMIPYIPTPPAAAPELTFNERQVALIRTLIAPDANEDELALFLEVCHATGLNPLFRQIYAIVRNKDDAKKRSMTIQTGIDGYRLLAARTGTLAGIDDANFDIDPAEPWHPLAAHVTVWRFVMGQRVPFSATARWSEYAQRNRDGNFTGMWSKDKMPFGQLAKCAEALALRKACPAELSGIYTGEEMGQADNPPLPYVDATPERQTPRPTPQPARQPATKSAPQSTPKPTSPQSPWKAMTDPDVLRLLDGLDIRGRAAVQAFLGTIKAEMEQIGLAWTRDQVLAHIRETYVAEVVDGAEVARDLAQLDTGAPGN